MRSDNLRASDAFPLAKRRSALRAIFAGKFALVTCAALYSLLINLTYHSISLIFSDVQGFTYKSSSTFMMILSSLVSALPALYLPARSRRVSSSILWIIFYTFYIPAISLAQHIITRDPFEMLGWMALLLIGFTITCTGHYLPVKNLKRIDIGYRGYFLFLISIWFIFVLITYINFGMSFNFSSLTDVYDQRADFKSQLASSGSSFAGYVIILSGYWLAPAMLLSGIYFNKLRLRYGWWLIFLGIFLSAYIYSVAAFKSIALSFVLVLAYARLLKMPGGVGGKVSFSLFAVVFFSWLLSSLPFLEFIAHHLVRRVFLVPGMNASYFYDYFTKWPDYAALAPPQAVSIFYYGTSGSANAGFLAAGYASAGAVGVLFAGATGAVALWVANIVTNRTPFVLAGAGFFMQSYALSNSALGTAMISYGFVFVILTFYLCPFRDVQFAHEETK